jgi:hypothetical protein
MNNIDNFINESKNDNYFVYDIVQKPDKSFSYKTNNPAIIKFIKSKISGISDNELNRFVTFTLNDIINNAPDLYFEKNELDKLQKHIEQDITSHSKSWMGMHSDYAIKRMM